jgi:UDP-N-acetylglucosamine 2-epimerase (non-hydrolysing)
MKELHAMVILGTRPESIKLAPVVHELRTRGAGVRASVVSTGQHREMLVPMLDLFGIRPDHDLALQRPDQTLEHVVSGVLAGLAPLLQSERPDVVVVQGDTATTFAAALVGFFRDVPVAHVEAGLRTKFKRIPFPEEMNRRLTTRLADLHLAPTARARDALLGEGTDPDTVLMTGNTVVDALHWLRRERGETVSSPAIAESPSGSPSATSAPPSATRQKTTPTSYSSTPYTSTPGCRSRSRRYSVDRTGSTCSTRSTIRP